MLLTGYQACWWPLTEHVRRGISAVQAVALWPRPAGGLLCGIWCAELCWRAVCTWPQQALDEQWLLHSCDLSLPHLAVPLASQLIQERLPLLRCEESLSEPHPAWANWSAGTHWYFWWRRSAFLGSSSSSCGANHSTTTIWGVNDDMVVVDCGGCGNGDIFTVVLW